MNAHQQARGNKPNRSNIVFWVFAGVAAYFLLVEHREHMFGFLPFLLILLCPLMHMFHHGHGGHGPDGKQSETPDKGASANSRSNDDQHVH